MPEADVAADSCDRPKRKKVELGFRLATSSRNARRADREEAAAAAKEINSNRHKQTNTQRHSLCVCVCVCCVVRGVCVWYANVLCLPRGN